MDLEERREFFKQLDDACVAAGVKQSERFCGLLDAMGEVDAPLWRVLSTGQIVESNKHFPGLTAMPAWDRDDIGDDDEEDPFPWLSKLESYLPAIAAERRRVCDAELPDGYDLGPENRRAMERLPHLTATERSIYVPGFGDHPNNGYCHTVLMTNDAAQPVAALFPEVMAALDACDVPLGVRLVAFGKQLPHTALHWHSDGRNYMLTAHLPLGGPSLRSGDRTPPFVDPALSAGRLPGVEARDGAAGMILSPLLAPRSSLRGRLLRWLGAVTRRRDPWSRAAERTAQAETDLQAVSRSWAAVNVFDTSFQHSAYNDGEEVADILFIDFYHPELTADEQATIRCLQTLLRAKGEAAYSQGEQ